MIEIFKARASAPSSELEDLAKEQFKLEILEHQKSVSNCMDFLMNKLDDAANSHDLTKIKYLDDFFQDTIQSKRKGVNFKALDWYQKHVTEERHHLLANPPEDVNLIDVIEMVCDCVSAGLSRDGAYNAIQMDPNLLQKAFDNTAKLLIQNAKLRDGDQA